jgi:fused signal recognition particle receptor
VAFNWFSKKGKVEGETPSEVTPTSEGGEQGSDPSAEPASADSSETSKATQTPEVESAAAEPTAEPESSESATDANNGEGDEKGEPEKKGFFRGAWEATKKLALTPVDPFFENMVAGLERTRKSLMGQLASVFRLHKKIDEDFWDELEDTLITSDVGTEATERIMQDLAAYAKEHNLSKPPELTERLREVITEILLTDEESRVLNIEPGRVNVILMVGVNGAGKTTSTAKLTQYFKTQGLSVLLAAADTFRAAAIEQLETWSKRLDVPLIKHKEGADPAAVVFDACSAAKARGVDILIIDTAGRLQNKSNLMKELEKIHRVIDREIPDAPHEVILVLDATTGQNALSQARQFSAVTPISGLVMCKLDGSARGGIMVAVAQEFGIPVKFIGVGEGVDDLRPFSPRLFIDALFGEAPVKD